MAKRKAGVQDIIYELDNDDLSGSSDEEHKKSKTKISKPNMAQQAAGDNSYSEDAMGDANKVHEHFINITSLNGGKSDSSDTTNRVEFIGNRNSSVQNKNNRKHSTTIILNKDIHIDSPNSNGDLSVGDSQNKTPLISIQFRDNVFAKIYKSKIKSFMLDLIKKHDTEGIVVDSDTDLELDIWPEEKGKDQNMPSIDHNLFFIDTAPCEGNTDIPMYKQASQFISNRQEEGKQENEPQTTRSRFACFNCGGEHQLKDCEKPRKHSRILENRRNLGVRHGRYHVEDEQKYGHLIPGRISGQLRHALGVKRYELPLYIYRMRLLGYPCGWMEEAKILPSGINMFDSTGTRVLDPEEEEGEVFEPCSKDLYDIKKIYDFPGFNVPTSSVYIEESHLYGLPPMSEQDSKFIMLERLAPNAMKAYKRKNLTCFPSSENTSQEGQAEMELDSGDDIAEFPSVPPLPDDEPPKLPSPPPPPPDLPCSPKQNVIEAISKIKSADTEKPYETPPLNSESNLPNAEKSKLVENKASLSRKKSLPDDSDNKSMDDIEIIEVIQVPDIPMPEDHLITMGGEDKISLLSSSGRNSPSIDDLEAKKQQLLDAIKSAEIANDSGTDTEISKEIIFDETHSQSTADESVELIEEFSVLESDPDGDTSKKEMINTAENLQTTFSEELSKTESVAEEPKSASQSTPEVKTGSVKDTLYGAPVINIASPFMKLPSDDKFAKDICDIINFENLPNSVGKYKKISSLLKKVKSEVDRIQES